MSFNFKALCKGAGGIAHIVVIDCRFQLSISIVLIYLGF